MYDKLTQVPSILSMTVVHHLKSRSPVTRKRRNNTPLRAPDVTRNPERVSLSFYLFKQVGQRGVLTVVALTPRKRVSHAPPVSPAKPSKVLEAIVDGRVPGCVISLHDPRMEKVSSLGNVSSSSPFIPVEDTVIMAGFDEILWGKLPEGVRARVVC